MDVAQAAANNAAWCDAVCRTHGLPGSFAAPAWTNPRRTPPLYPDAVTLRPDAKASDVLDHIDASEGASVKDSFASLDLASAGFEVLFEAQWIHRPAGLPVPEELTTLTGDTVQWDLVRHADDLREWETGIHEGLFRPELLADETVSVLRGTIEGDLVCGSVLNTSGAVVGVSNVFALGCDMGAVWAGTLAMAARLHPDRALVGWEDEVPDGFEPLGPLRVWLAS